MIKQSIGHEKEVYLKRRAKELNLVFKDEDQMRAEGEPIFRFLSQIEIVADWEAD